MGVRTITSQSVSRVVPVAGAMVAGTYFADDPIGMFQMLVLANGCCIGSRVATLVNESGSASSLASRPVVASAATVALDASATTLSTSVAESPAAESPAAESLATDAPAAESPGDASTFGGTAPVFEPLSHVRTPSDRNVTNKNAGPTALCIEDASAFRRLA